MVYKTELAFLITTKKIWRLPWYQFFCGHYYTFHICSCGSIKNEQVVEWSRTSIKAIICSRQSCGVLLLDGGSIFWTNLLKSSSNIVKSSCHCVLIGRHLRCLWNFRREWVIYQVYRKVCTFVDWNETLYLLRIILEEKNVTNTGWKLLWSSWDTAVTGGLPENMKFIFGKILDTCQSIEDELAPEEKYRMHYLKIFVGKIFPYCLYL